MFGICQCTEGENKKGIDMSERTCADCDFVQDCELEEAECRRHPQQLTVERKDQEKRNED